MHIRGSLRREMKRCIEDIGVYNLRYSHVSLRLHLGYFVVAIGERVGHKSKRITLYYRHLLSGGGDCDEIE